jgi:hypothetical protein
METKTNKRIKSKQTSVTELIKLTDKANPKPEHLEMIRKHLDDNAALVKLNEVGQRAIVRVIETYSDSALMRELYQRQIEQKRVELGYDSGCVIERMLINQLALCHLRLSLIEMYHAEKVKQSHSTEVGMYWDRLLTTYQRRFERACLSLAKVKKLLAEANSHDERARRARTASTKNSVSILKMMSG